MGGYSCLKQLRKNFVSRVEASLLKAVLLPELIYKFSALQEFAWYALYIAFRALRIFHIALRRYVRTLLKCSINTIAEAIKLIPPLLHPILEYEPPIFNLVEVWCEMSITLANPRDAQ